MRKDSKIDSVSWLSSFALIWAASTGLGQPLITRQPTNQFVSLGADVTLLVSANSATPLTYQWRFNSSDVIGAASSSLNMTNVQSTNAGDYLVVIADSSGSVTSRVAHLDVDPTFRKITQGPIVTDHGEFFNCSWADFDNDGYLDLFAGASSGTNNHLYHNNNDGTFTRVPLANLPPSGNQEHSGVWGDYNNDGFVDLFVSGGQLETGAPGSYRNVLYQNNGDGTFLMITNGVFATEIGQFHGAAWADYDRDGFLDLFVTHHGESARVPPAKNRLYHNNGDGTFTKITNGVVVNDLGDYWGRAWADYDNDGWPDLFVADVAGRKNHLYHNDGYGRFSSVTNSIVAQEIGPSQSAAWADYDNDGLLDLLVVNIDFSNSANTHNFLYHNEGNGRFTKVTRGAIVEDTALGGFSGCAWADYDNDGFIDLIVQAREGIDGSSRLYHNNGDGTFTRVSHGSVTGDRGSDLVYAWGDYDRDGFLDLFVAQGGGWAISHPVGTPYPSNFLYHNNGNSNAWIDIKLVGTVSNRSAIGAKVRVKAFYRGASRWQLREISGGDGSGNQQPLSAHFGLGDATNIDAVRIEWPLGAVQTLTNVPVKQFLTITEPPRLSFGLTNGTPQFWVKGGRGLQYQIDASADLQVWSLISVLTITNANGTAEITETNPPVADRRFYRALSR